MTSFKKLIREIHRRSLWQVLAIYLAGSWVAFEVVGEVTEAAALPDWVPGFALVLLIIGLPIVLATAFVQEGVGGGSPEPEPPRGSSDDGGLEGGSSAGPAAPGEAGPAVARAAANPERSGRGRLFTWRNAALGGVGAFALLGIATAASVVFGVAAGSQEGTEVDENAVAVLPFRVTGSQELDYLREGMVDLLAAKLTGEGGPRAIDSRTMLAAWHSAVREDDGQLGPAEASRLALDLGAPRVLLGEVVGRPSRITINASLIDSRSNGDPIRAEAIGPADSLPSLVDRLAADLLGRFAGYDPARLAVVTSASLPALRSYLVGMQAYRQGDFSAAVAAFDRAQDTDTTFVLAGLMQAYALGWEGFGPDYEANLRRAWEARDRLPPLERALVEAQVDSSYPPARPWAARIGPSEEIVGRWPGSAEAWYALGDVLYHAGSTLGLENAQRRSAQALDRALEIDSTYGPAIRHRLELAVLEGDTALARRYARRHLGDAMDRWTSSEGWLVAAALEDTARIRAIVARYDDMSPGDLTGIGLHSLGAGLNDENTTLAVSTALGRVAGTPAIQQLGPPLGGYYFTVGQPGRVTEEVTPHLPPWFASTYLVFNAIFEDLPAAMIEPAVDATAEALGSPDAPPELRVGAGCLLGAYHAVHEDTARARQAIALAAAALEDEGEDDPDRTAARLCVESAQVLADLNRGPVALARTERLDSLLAGTNLDPAFTELGIYAMSLAHEARGDLDAALRSIRRITSNSALLAPALLREARVAARLERFDEARAAYSRYLSLRPDPEPGPAAEAVARARAELAALRGRID